MSTFEHLFEGANLVTPIEVLPQETDSSRPLEQILAERYGGEPLDYFAFVSEMASQQRETGVTCSITEEPIDDPESMFNGYCHIELYTDSTVHGLIKRSVYATHEQLEKGEGKLKLPREGIFIRDEDQHWYLGGE